MVGVVMFMQEDWNVRVGMKFQMSWLVFKIKLRAESASQLTEILLNSLII